MEHDRAAQEINDAANGVALVVCLLFGGPIVLGLLGWIFAAIV